MKYFKNTVLTIIVLFFSTAVVFSQGEEEDTMQLKGYYSYLGQLANGTDIYIGSIISFNTKYTNPKFREVVRLHFLLKDTVRSIKVASEKMDIDAIYGQTEEFAKSYWKDSFIMGFYGLGICPQPLDLNLIPHDRLVATYIEDMCDRCYDYVPERKQVYSWKGNQFVLETETVDTNQFSRVLNLLNINEYYLAKEQMQLIEEKYGQLKNRKTENEIYDLFLTTAYKLSMQEFKKGNLKDAIQYSADILLRTAFCFNCYGGCPFDSTSIEKLKKDEIVIRLKTTDKKGEVIDDYYHNYNSFSPTPELLSILNDMAYFLALDPDYTKNAIDILQQIIKFDPERTVAHLNIADALWEEKRYEDARQHYQEYTNQVTTKKLNVKLPARVKMRING